LCIYFLFICLLICLLILFYFIFLLEHLTAFYLTSSITNPFPGILTADFQRLSRDGVLEWGRADGSFNKLRGYDVCDTTENNVHQYDFRARMQWNPILASASSTSVSASPNGGVRHTPPTVKPFGVRNGPICPTSMSTNGHRIRHSSLFHPKDHPLTPLVQSPDDSANFIAPHTHTHIHTYTQAK